MDVVLRVVAVPIVAVALGGLPVGGPALADPAATRVITAVAVGSDGQPVNGYREAPAQGNVTAVDNCTTPSPSAVADNIYYCSPSAANAGTCWPSTPESLLCVDNPWDKRLHRVTYGGPLPLLHPIATPDPFALALDDGTHCLLRNGGAWGAVTTGTSGSTVVARRREPRGFVAPQSGRRDLRRPLGAGVDGQGGPAGHTG
ncbi:hypothetical protein I546_5468 [Mycobacterium kansasii 732]|nr:hypothetical protein I546_5468 [Mycobacterium kansasii 732]